ncbi:hypothetical protein [Chitinophaga sp. HK235]|uniref:hypothetical protein n=1 Tax=Chitinophaga sp. HK235 TaxID=2952571 RepID=UPI001BA69B0C|nr:hypothetical protein [Chitinophaga sp. HK235]
MHIRILMAVAFVFCCTTLFAQRKKTPQPRFSADTLVTAAADARIWPHALYGSLFSPACGFGLNYDVRFTRRRTGLGARMGIGFAPEYRDSWADKPSRPRWNGSVEVDTGRHYLSVPNRPSIFGGLNYVVGQPDKNCAELGAGMTYLFGDSLWFEEGASDRTLVGWTAAAWRRHFKRHFMMKIGGMLMFSSNRVTPNLDLGFGYCW